MTQSFCFSRSSCLWLAQERCQEENLAKCNLLNYALWDWNNCLVLDVEQTSLPSKCSTCLETYRENLSSSFFFPCCYTGFTCFLLHKKKKGRQDPIYPQNKRTGIHPLELIGSSRESTFFVWLICRTHCNILPWRWGDRSISHTNLKRFTS